MNLKNKRILITGAAFIGSHLIKRLIKEKAASIGVVNLTDKHFSLLQNYSKDIEIIKADLRNLEIAKKYSKNIDIIFHLAAAHGGRGYVDKYQADTSTNFLLDGSVFFAALQNNVEKIFYASSGCVYPNYKQTDTQKEIYLKEIEVKPPYDADNTYGWAKLVGELTLKNYYKEYGLKSAIARFFTVYGENADESHAVIATIAKAFIKQDPFEIWGDGKQIRNWTYVEDIVEGIILAVKKIDDVTAVNLGIKERISVNEMTNLVFEYTRFKPKKIKHLKNMPSGPLNRVADNSLAKRLLGWKPKYSFKEGLKKTIKWYFETKNKEYVKKNLAKLLMRK